MTKIPKQCSSCGGFCGCTKKTGCQYGWEKKPEAIEPRGEQHHIALGALPPVCQHGRQRGKCEGCELDEAYRRIAELEESVEKERRTVLIQFGRIKELEAELSDRLSDRLSDSPVCQHGRQRVKCADCELDEADTPEQLWEIAPKWIEHCGEAKRYMTAILELVAMGLLTVTANDEGEWMMSLSSAKIEIP